MKKWANCGNGIITNELYVIRNPIILFRNTLRTIQPNGIYDQLGNNPFPRQKLSDYLKVSMANNIHFIFTFQHYENEK